MLYMYIYIPYTHAHTHTHTHTHTRTQPGTLYVVMESIVMEGSDETLEPGDTVELVKMEPVTGLLRVKTLDDHPIEGMIPESYLRKKDTLRGGKMESKCVRSSVVMILTINMHIIV